MTARRSGPPCPTCGRPLTQAMVKRGASAAAADDALLPEWRRRLREQPGLAPRVKVRAVKRKG